MIRLLLLMLVLASVLCGNPALAKTLSKVVAIVNNDIISSYQLDKSPLCRCWHRMR